MCAVRRTSRTGRTCVQFAHKRREVPLPSRPKQLVHVRAAGLEQMDARASICDYRGPALLFNLSVRPAEPA